jgi:hypothetical protein
MNNSRKKDDLRPEYSEDLIRSGIRGKYAKRYRSQSNVIVVDDDLTDVFPNAKAVNDALRDYLELRKKAAT